jgi:phosphate uptake regulator/tRNA A-37 threonylcarbamoyl transferase component Bud32
MPIDEGVNVDLQLLILEVKKQARASMSCIERPTSSKARRIREREEYIDNLKNTIENKSYFHIHHLEEADRQLNYFRAVITIGSNLERIADFFVNITDQLGHLNDPEYIKVYKFKSYYQLIYRALDMVYPALTRHDLDLAEKICDIEDTIDTLWDKSFLTVRKNLKKQRRVDDNLTILFISRYLERVGDSFLNIGEAILNIRLGEKLGIKQFRNLEKGLSAQGIDINSARLEFKSIMNTRSGSRVAKIATRKPDGEELSVFYKEGLKEKIDEEVSALKRWQRIPAVHAPEIMWHESRQDHATLLLEYIHGNDLLDVLINQPRKVDECLSLLESGLTRLWKETLRNKSVKSEHVSELIKRRDDIMSMHDHLFGLEKDLDALLLGARRLESQLKSPFSTLIHGDFNVDNIIFKPGDDKVYFVDVHRSRYGDYAQDVSVFLVSSFRVPIFSSDIRSRLNEANQRMYQCAVRFAQSKGDKTFDARLALGLFRSLITSTRFLFDEGFSSDMFLRGTGVLKDLLVRAERPEKFKLSESYFLYG